MFHFIKKMGLNLKLVVSFILISVISIGAVGIFSYFIASSALTKEIESDLGSMSDGYVSASRVAYKANVAQLKINLSDIKKNIRDGIVINNKTLQVDTENQITHDKKTIDLPEMTYNKKDLYRDNELVDQINQTTGFMATIFQAEPDGLLRVSTTVKNLDGSRAVGTFIPKDSPVYQAIITGNEYYGKAFVVTDWYLAGYSPLTDNDGKIIGAVFIGMKEIDMPGLRSEILGKTVGKTGYVFVMDSLGNLIIHPKMEGSNVINFQDTKGNYFMKEMISNKNGVIYYPWKNPGDILPRDKIAVYRYLPELDWVVAASSYMDEFDQPIISLRNTIIAIFIILLIITFIFSFLISRGISRSVTAISGDIFSSSNSLESAANQVSSSSQELSGGASELAASVEEMTSSLEELQSIIESNTKSVNEAELMMRETNEGNRNSMKKMDDLTMAMTDINDNSKKIVKIVKVIDDIAFQTNILALNAAVEAARAGDAGRGFAVVAELVKNLAQKSADAAKETTDLIEKASEAVEKGEQRGVEVREVLAKAVDLAGKVGTLLDEINSASKEQLKGANQVTKAVSQINTVVQGTAASSEETAAAGEELLSQAETLKDVVGKLNQIVKGEGKTGFGDLENKKPGIVTRKFSGIAERAHNSHEEIHKLRMPDINDSSNEIEIIKPEDKIPLEDFKDF